MAAVRQWIKRLAPSTNVLDCRQAVRSYLESIGHTGSTIAHTPVFVRYGAGGKPGLRVVAVGPTLESVKIEGVDMASSVHFSDRELACRHCGVNNSTQELVDALEAFRAIVSAARGADTPVIVDDAYRCPVYNAAVRFAALHSQHELGAAADIRVEGATAAELYTWARQVPAFRGLGRNDHANFLHVDVRLTPARWCYDVRGASVPWYDSGSASSKGLS